MTASELKSSCFSRINLNSTHEYSAIILSTEIFLIQICDIEKMNLSTVDCLSSQVATVAVTNGDATVFFGCNRRRIGIIIMDSAVFNS